MKQIVIFLSILFITFNLDAMKKRKPRKRGEWRNFKTWFNKEWNQLENFTPKLDDYKITAFICAGMYEDLNEKIGQLLEAGLDPDITIENWDTCLYVAVQKGSVNNVKLLLRYGANPNGISLHYPLHEAVKNGYLEIINLLLHNQGKKNKADPNLQDAESGFTPLMIACHESNEPYGKNIHNGCYTKDLALRTDVILALLKSGTDVLIKNVSNKMASDIASESKLPLVASLLNAWAQPLSKELN